MDFETWLKTNTKLMASTIKDYAYSFNHLADMVLENSGRDSLRSSNKASVVLFIDILFNNADFIEFDKKAHGKYSAALKYYKLYL